MNKSFSMIAGLLGLFCVLPSHAKFDASGFIEFEVQQFTQEAADIKQDDTFGSLASELDIYWRSESEAHALQFKPFGRITTAEDGARDHADIRELYYRFASGGWQVLAGVNKVFWGVMESAHLVDIINQTDSVESFGGEEKLGQPMIALGLEQAWGNLDLYVLPYFRERKFYTGSERYQVLALPIDDKVIQYEHEDEEKHVDYAVRWAHYFGSLDIAISYFNGTNREPLIILSNFNPSTAQPTESSYAYEQLEQVGLELQYLFDGLALKFEGVHKQLESGDYNETVAGFEYTWGDLGESGFDIGLLMEYLWNDRAEVNIKEYSINAASEKLNQPITTLNTLFSSLPQTFQNQLIKANGELLSPFNNDIFIGARFSLNDIDSTQFLAGVISDADTQESLVTFEGSRRFGNSLKFSLNIYLLTNISDDAQKSAFAPLQQDDAIEAKLKWYF